MDVPNPTPVPEPKPAPRNYARWVWAAVLLAVAGFILLKIAAVRRGDSVSFVVAELASPASHLLHDKAGENHDILADTRFRITSNRPPPWVRLPLPGVTDNQRKEYLARWEMATPKPELSRMGGSAGDAYSIDGILYQCTELTGVQFAIAHDVASGSVRLGPSKGYTGREFVATFTGALQTNQPDWWARDGRTQRKENLVLLSREGRLVLVLPATMAPEFRAKGFKDFRWGFETK